MFIWDFSDSNQRRWSDCCFSHGRHGSKVFTAHSPPVLGWRRQLWSGHRQANISHDVSTPTWVNPSWLSSPWVGPLSPPRPSLSSSLLQSVPWGPPSGTRCQTTAVTMRTLESRPRVTTLSTGDPRPSVSRGGPSHQERISVQDRDYVSVNTWVMTREV